MKIECVVWTLKRSEQTRIAFIILSKDKVLTIVFKTPVTREKEPLQKNRIKDLKSGRHLRNLDHQCEKIVDRRK